MVWQIVVIYVIDGLALVPLFIFSSFICLFIFGFRRSRAQGFRRCLGGVRVVCSKARWLGGRCTAGPAIGSLGTLAVLVSLFPWYGMVRGPAAAISAAATGSTSVVHV